MLGTKATNASVLFAVAALSVVFLRRRDLADPHAPARRSLAWVALLHCGAFSLLILALLPGEAQNALLMILPMLALACYAGTFGFGRLVAPRWRASPFFKLAAMAPLLGFVLVVLVLLSEPGKNGEGT
jgi:hypothetical protein